MRIGVVFVEIPRKLSQEHFEILLATLAGDIGVALYALNLFDLADNDLYNQYSRRSPDAVSKHGGRLVALGRFSEVLQGEEGVEPRRVLVLVEWPSHESLQAFLDDPELADLHPLRKDGTRNYLWWIYERLEDLRPVLFPLTSSPSDERSQGP